LKVDQAETVATQLERFFAKVVVTFQNDRFRGRIRRDFLQDGCFLYWRESL
jgi:hypothetical protein